MLENEFMLISSAHTSNRKLIHSLWTEIVYSYSKPERHYHNLLHLNDCYAHLSKIKNEIRNWQTVFYAISFHDIVYEPTSHDNEEKSAEFARYWLAAINFPSKEIEIVSELILATKTHQAMLNQDSKLFLDVDLSILGSEPLNYSIYCQQIRQEYAMFPDHLYNSRRLQVLRHFLKMDRIYKSDYFYQVFEKQARVNLYSEIKSLEN